MIFDTKPGIKKCLRGSEVSSAECAGCLSSMQNSSHCRRGMLFTSRYIHFFSRLSESSRIHRGNRGSWSAFGKVCVRSRFKIVLHLSGVSRCLSLRKRLSSRGAMPRCDSSTDRVSRVPSFSSPSHAHLSYCDIHAECVSRETKIRSIGHGEFP